MKVISNILSEAIEQALVDLELCVRDPEYAVDFSDWHGPTDIGGQFSDERSICSVCFAGSVMAKSLESGKTDHVQPENFDDSTKDMLHALDAIRQGHIHNALVEIALDLDDYPNLVKAVEVNQQDYHQFRDDMKTIINILKKQGL